MLKGQISIYELLEEINDSELEITLENLEEDLVVTGILFVCYQGLSFSTDTVKFVKLYDDSSYSIRIEFYCTNNQLGVLYVSEDEKIIVHGSQYLKRSLFLRKEVM